MIYYNVCVDYSDNQRTIEKMVDERIKAMNADVQVGFTVLLSWFRTMCCIIHGT